MITEPANPTHYNATDLLKSLGFDINEPLRIGKALRVFRTAEGYTLKQIAQQVGISEQRLSDYEHSRHYPSYDRMIKWAAAVGYNPVFALQEQLTEQLNASGLSVASLKLKLS
jgi:transcriptional regulator with XRE-family HTH domain